MAGETALWHLERKPTMPMVHPIGSLKAFPAQEESGFAWLHVRRVLTPLWTYPNNLEIHVCPGEEL